MRTIVNQLGAQQLEAVGGYAQVIFFISALGLTYAIARSIVCHSISDQIATSSLDGRQIYSAMKLITNVRKDQSL